MMPKWRVLKPM